MIRKFAISMVGAVLTSVALTTAASAVVLTYGGQNNGRAHVYTTNSTAAPNVGASSGVFTMNVDGTSTSFLAWCLDLYSYLANGSYTPLTGPFTGPGTGANPNPFPNSNDDALTDQRLANIENLFEVNATAVQAIYSTGNTSANNVQSAGFQLALWELVYETNGMFDLTTGIFQATGSTTTKIAINNAANAFLGNLGGTILQNYDLTFWEHDSGVNQNLVSITENNGQMSPVPLPAAGLLLIAGLAGLGVAGRRRKG